MKDDTADMTAEGTPVQIISHITFKLISLSMILASFTPTLWLWPVIFYTFFRILHPFTFELAPRAESLQ